MRTLLLLLPITILSLSLSIEQDTPVIKSEKDLSKYVGLDVRLEGEIINSKIPTLLGVDIDCDDELRGKKAFAVGKLISWTVKPSDVDPYSANRGAGTFYKLVDEKGELARAQAL